MGYLNKNKIILSFLFIFLSNNLWAALSIEEVDAYKTFEQNKKEIEQKKKDVDKKQKNKTSEDAKNDNDKVKKDPQELPTFCNTAKEFQEAYTTLYSNPLIELPDRDVVQASYEVTKGCDGAADRFKRILTFLINTGVDKRKSVEISLQFAMRTEKETEAFTQVFKGTFLEKYMDMDFKTSLRTSFKLALTGKGEPDIIAKDFRSILDYCLENKRIDLPFKTCAPLALELTKFTYLYGKDGLSEAFKKMMTYLQTQKEIDYNIAQGIKNTARILRFGPKAIENFEKQYEFSISDKMRLPRKAALELAIRIAENTISKESKDIMHKEISREPFVVDALIPEKKLEPPKTSDSKIKSTLPEKPTEKK